MSSGAGPGIPPDNPALYEIRIKGALDHTWCDLLDGASLTVVEGDGHPVTVIRAIVQDQAALAGLLDALFGLNAAVLSVEALRPD